MKNILFLIPHPDDEVVGSCIIIKEYLKRKKISIFFLTNGVISEIENWPWLRKNNKKDTSIRYQEMLKSLKYLNIKNFFYQDIHTRTLKFNIEQTYTNIENIINTQNIDTIFCPAYEGGHQDHDIANFLGSKFKNTCKVFEFPEYNFFGKKINSNKFFNSENNEIIIHLNQNQINFKKQCLLSYSSEKKNLNYLKIIQECFRPIRKYNYSKPPHKGILFYRRYSFFSWHPRVDSCTPYDVCAEMKNSKIFYK